MTADGIGPVGRSATRRQGVYDATRMALLDPSHFRWQTCVAHQLPDDTYPTAFAEGQRLLQRCPDHEIANRV